jgi:hypothetical protein
MERIFTFPVQFEVRRSILSVVEGPVLSTLSGIRLRVNTRRGVKTKRYRRALSIELRVRLDIKLFRALIYNASFSRRSTVSAKTWKAVFTGSGLVRSTPAIFRTSRGYCELPALKKLR